MRNKRHPDHHAAADLRFRFEEVPEVGMITDATELSRVIQVAILHIFKMKLNEVVVIR